MLFTHEIEFNPTEPASALACLPPRSAVFCLRGDTGEPYISHTRQLRGRLEKLLMPSPRQTKRLHLAALVRRIAWRETGSDFAGQLLLYRAFQTAFGDRAAAKLHLRSPYFLRVGMQNRYPRIWVTNVLSLRAAADLFGPFPSRRAAERYAEDVLDLHLLRRCFQDLIPDPEFPGCIYSEMKKCLAPCYGGCSDERYRVEASEVRAFLATRGESTLSRLALERDGSSERLDFEAARSAHTRLERVREIAQAFPAGVAASLAGQDSIIVQPSADPDGVELFSVSKGILAGPCSFSLLGLSLPNEQSGSTSLFAHPVAFQPVPMGESEDSSLSPDERLGQILVALANSAREAAVPGDHQAILARWLFRPANKRVGELINAADGGFKLPNLLRACVRVYRAQMESAKLFEH